MGMCREYGGMTAVDDHANIGYDWMLEKQTKTGKTEGLHASFTNVVQCQGTGKAASEVERLRPRLQLPRLCHQRSDVQYVSPSLREAS